jgi:hypothetical protein
MATKKITLNELRRLVKQVIKENSFDKDYYIATDMDDLSGPGETRAHKITSDEYSDYEEKGWYMDGPFTEREADERLDNIKQSNSDWRYHNQFSDDELDNQNPYIIDKQDKFEKGSLDLDKNW